MLLRDRLHGHECPRCSYVWEHHPDDMKSREEFDAGHTCQRCGCDAYECATPIPPPSAMRKVFGHLEL